MNEDKEVQRNEVWSVIDSNEPKCSASKCHLKKSFNIFGYMLIYSLAKT